MSGPHVGPCHKNFLDTYMCNYLGMITLVQTRCPYTMLVSVSDLEHSHPALNTNPDRSTSFIMIFDSRVHPTLIRAGETPHISVKCGEIRCRVCMKSIDIHLRHSLYAFPAPSSDFSSIAL